MSDNRVERWAAIPSRPGYEVSDLGRVRSVDRTIVQKNGHLLRRRGQMLTPQVHPNGYVLVITGSRLKGGWVHRLVLEAFVGPCPAGMEACHGPGGQRDNRLVNLRWGTHTDNVQDTIRAGRKAEQRRTHCPQNHRLALPNLVKSQLPNRKCMACNRGHAAVQRMEKRGQTADFVQLADGYYADIMQEVAA